MSTLSAEEEEEVVWLLRGIHAGAESIDAYA
jgi:hypothetical protein